MATTAAEAIIEAVNCHQDSDWATGKHKVVGATAWHILQQLN